MVLCPFIRTNKNFLDIEVKLPSSCILSFQLKILNLYKDTKPIPLEVLQTEGGTKKTLWCDVKAPALLKKQDWRHFCWREEAVGNKKNEDETSRRHARKKMEDQIANKTMKRKILDVYLLNTWNAMKTLAGKTTLWTQETFRWFYTILGKKKRKWKRLRKKI